MIPKFLWIAWLCSGILFSGNIEKFVSSARWQVGKTTGYNPEYVRLKFPNGDIPLSKGVCTDVIIRALRKLHIDLQQRIYRDKKPTLDATKGSTIPTDSTPILTTDGSKISRLIWLPEDIRSRRDIKNYSSPVTSSSGNSLAPISIISASAQTNTTAKENHS